MRVESTRIVATRKEGKGTNWNAGIQSRDSQRLAESQRPGFQAGAGESVRRPAAFFASASSGETSRCPRGSQTHSPGSLVQIQGLKCMSLIQTRFSILFSKLRREPQAPGSALSKSAKASSRRHCAVGNLPGLAIGSKIHNTGTPGIREGPGSRGRTYNASSESIPTVWSDDNQHGPWPPAPGAHLLRQCPQIEGGRPLPNLRFYNMSSGVHSLPFSLTSPTTLLPVVISLPLPADILPVDAPLLLPGDSTSVFALHTCCAFGLQSLLRCCPPECFLFGFPLVCTVLKCGGIFFRSDGREPRLLCL